MRFTTLITIIVASSLSLIACGGGGGDDGDDGDDTAAPDANENTPPDANEQPATGIGAPCTPDGADPMGQGTCATGEVCLSLEGGSGAWCSKTCLQGKTDDPIAQCNPSVAAPTGLGYCYLQVDFDGTGGNPPVGFCGIICDEGQTGICGGNGETCDMSCPSPLACTAELSSGNPPMVVAHGCE